jgi:DNA polymerase-3 subunit alpha
MAATLSSDMDNTDKIVKSINECREMGISILPPDINESLANFTVVPGQNQIRFGLTAIKNVGQNIVKTIAQERKENGPYQSIAEFITRTNSKDLNKKSLESLIKTGVFDTIAERNQLLFNLERLLEWSREIQRIKNNHQRALFSGAEINNQFQLIPAAPASKNEKLNWEKELLGLFISSHPLEGFKKIFDKVLPISKITAEISDRSSLAPSKGHKRFQQIKTGGVISKIKKVLTRIGKPMLFLSLEDQTDKIEVIVFPAVIERNPAVFQENKIVLVSGRVDSRDGVPKLICEEIEEIINTD